MLCSRVRRCGGTSVWQRIDPAETAVKRNGIGDVVEIGEFRLFLDEAQLDILHGPVTVLGHDDFGGSGLQFDPVLVVVDAVVFGPVDEGYDVGVLLDGARFTQVGELRALVAAARLHRTVELREGDDRNIELLGDRLERP